MLHVIDARPFELQLAKKTLLAVVQTRPLVLLPLQRELLPGKIKNELRATERNRDPYQFYPMPNLFIVLQQARQDEVCPVGPVDLHRGHDSFDAALREPLLPKIDVFVQSLDILHVLDDEPVRFENVLQENIEPVAVELLGA